MKKQNNNSINSDALATLKSMIHPQVEIVDLQVHGRWLRASLSSGVFFSVKNQSSKLKRHG